MELRPHIYDGDDFSVDGSVEMWVEIHSATNQIVMHMENITLQYDTLKVAYVIISICKNGQVCSINMKKKMNILLASEISQ